MIVSFSEHFEDFAFQIVDTLIMFRYLRETRNGCDTVHSAINSPSVRPNERPEF